MRNIKDFLINAAALIGGIITFIIMDMVVLGLW